ncbi:MAG: PilC/PilY family type IV pilus protein [Pseudomonadota bacterium]
MKNQLVKSLLITTALVFNLSAMAEDIDLFVGPPASPTDLPNLMIVLDNAANFSSNASGTGTTCTIDGSTNSLAGTVGGIEQCAIYKVISEIKPLSADADIPVVNIGMMIYNASNIRDVDNANCGGSLGGCLAQPLVPLNKANKTKFLAWIKSWKTNGGAGSGYVKANGQATAAAMQETWAYFAGRTGISNRSYAGIKPAEGCQNNYVVFVGNSYSSSGTPGDSSPSGNGPENSLKGLNPVTDKNANPVATSSQKELLLNGVKTSCGNFTFPTSSHENKGFIADEWARYMKEQNITTYTVGVLGSSCQESYAGLLTNMATYGGGEYYPTNDYTTLVTAFQRILSQIQSVDSVFSSVSLPVSVNTQGTFLNQVYIGMFRPDQGSRPRWYGNLKQYKLGFSNNVLKLLDANDDSAISANGNGFISECARSYWTPTSLDSYWAFKPKANCSVTANSDISNTPDGNVVEKGAQGFKLRSTTTRNVQTCSNASCTALANFDTDNPSVQLGVIGSERDTLINWARGLDVSPSITTTETTVGTEGVDGDEDKDGVTLTEMRPSAHSDVVHSRPVAINHGTVNSPQVVVYYGSNDGMLHAVNGSRDKNVDGSVTTIGGKSPGSELWSFVAPEFYSKIKRIRDNTTTISFPSNIATSPLPQPKDYGVDGAITAYEDATSASIFATMRRGGRAVYAFNVPDSNPATPSLRWKIGCPNTGNDIGCTPGFTGLGQTWSAPKVLTASGYGSGTTPMLIMGGGYDTCHDADSNTACSASSKGNKIYIMGGSTDAGSTGVLLQTFTTDNSVIADITVVTDNAGMAKYAYAADLGGNIYRISGATANTPIGNTPPGTDSWTMTKIAALGGIGEDNRKFMFAPDWIEDSGTYTLLLGSGDREKPLSTNTSATVVKNRFYVVKDKPTDTNWLTSESGTCNANVMCNDSLRAIPLNGATPTATDLAAKKGWYLALNSTEQVVTSAITVFNTVTFSTHQPTLPESNACTTLGTARVYNLDYTNAATQVGFVRGETIAGGGLPPSPVAGLVTLDNGKTVPFIIGANPTSALQGGSPKVPPSAIRPKSRVYWNIKK